MSEELRRELGEVRRELEALKRQVARADGRPRWRAVERWVLVGALALAVLLGPGVGLPSGQGASGGDALYVREDGHVIVEDLIVEDLEIQGTNKPIGNAPNATLRLKSTTQEGDWTVSAKSGDGGLQFYNHHNKQVRMYLLPNGHLGIGTTDPRAPLHIRGGRDAGLKETLDGYVMLGDPAADHLLLDDNEIMAKRGQTGAAPLYLNRDGSKVEIGGGASNADLVVNGGVTGRSLRLGSVEITSSELDVLKRLADGELRVAIKSHKGYYLDNFGHRVNDGDGDRTIQFQRGPPGNWGKFYLEIHR